MDKFPNGAGYFDHEDVPRNLSDEVTEDDIQQAKEDGECVRCGGEMVDRMVGDEIYEVCGDCNSR